MRPRFEKVPLSEQGACLAFERVWPKRRFDGAWHFHPEVELTLIIEGQGRRFAGDDLEPFAEGDLVLLGSNLPHFWQTVLTPARARAIVIQFDPLRCGLEEKSAVMSELGSLRRLVAESRRGLAYSRATAQMMQPLLQAVAQADSPADRLIRLLAALSALAQRAPRRQLASLRFQPSRDRVGEERMQRVYRYVLDHLREPLSLGQVARVAGLSREGFSRYFKRTTGRWFSDFLVELRVQESRRLLVETEGRVADIAFASGFGTLAHFNRRFRALTGRTPRQYRTDYRASVQPTPETAMPIEVSPR